MSALHGFCNAQGGRKSPDPGRCAGAVLPRAANFSSRGACSAVRLRVARGDVERSHSGAPRRLKPAARVDSGVVLWLCVVAVSLVSAGCGPPFRNLYDPKVAILPVPTEFHYNDWATVLRENVKDGLVDYDHLAAHAEPLDQFLAAVASVGPRSAPELFPTSADRAVYYVNAFNAALLKAVLSAEVPPTMHDVRVIGLETGNRVRADRRVQALGALRRSALKESADDARVALCLCDAALGSPPLWARPFRGPEFEEQLRRVGREAMANPRMVEVNHELQKLNLSAVLHRNAEGLIDLYCGQTGSRSRTMLGALLHLASGKRREWLNTAVGYQIGRIPFDRRLNAWSRATSEGQHGR